MKAQTSVAAWANVLPVKAKWPTLMLVVVHTDGFNIIQDTSEKKRRPGNKSDLGRAKVELMRRILKSEPCSVIRLSQLLKANQRAISNALKALGAVPAGKVFSPSGRRRLTTWRLSR